MKAAWPLTGRDRELDAVMTAIGSVRDQHGGLVLAGPAGVGKTRLAREAVDRAARQGRRVRWATGTSASSSVPLGAFAEFTNGCERPTDTIRLACQALLGDDRADILVVDDAHLLDDGSALLVHQLAMQHTISLVVTIRTGLPPPDAVTALWKDEHLTRLDVSPLTRDQSMDLLDRVLPGHTPLSTSDALWDLTRGNVMFLRQLVQDERRVGRLHFDGDSWVWPGHPALSHQLADLVLAEMGRLDAPAAEAMDLLALGEPLSLSILEQLSRPEVLERLERQGLLTIDPTELLARVAHPLYGETCRSRMGTLTARRLRGRLAEKLSSTDLTGPGLLRYALLTLDSDLKPDPELFTRAAMTAARLVDLDLSERLARAAADAGGGFVPRLAMAVAIGFRSRGGEAQHAFAAATAEANTEAERRMVAVCRGANELWTLGDPAAAQRVVDAARAVEPSGGSDELCSIEAAVAASRGRPRQAIELGRRALAEPGITAPSIMAASYGLVGALAVAGSVTELTTAADWAYQELENAPELSFLQFGLAHLYLLGLHLAGELGRTDSVVRNRRQAATYLPGQARPYGQSLMGHAAADHGRLVQALALLNESLGGLGTAEGTGFRYLGLIHRTRCLAQLGRSREARQSLNILVAAPHPAFAFLAPDVHLARAWVAAAEGSVDRALLACHAAARSARHTDAPAYEVLALQHAVGFGDRTVAERLAQLASVVEGPRASTAHGYAVAAQTQDGDGLLAAAGEFAAMGDLVAAANAAAQATISYARSNHRGSGAFARERATRWQAECDGAVTPALTQALQPLPLTGRQREIGRLVGDGLSNAEIADRLVLSVRTVEGHVYRACAQLGLTDRAELVWALQGLPDGVDR